MDVITIELEIPDYHLAEMQDAEFKIEIEKIAHEYNLNVSEINMSGDGFDSWPRVKFTGHREKLFRLWNKWYSCGDEFGDCIVG